MHLENREMRILEDHSLLAEHKAALFHREEEMQFAAVENEYRYHFQLPSDFREDMILNCHVNCRTRTWKGYYFHRINPPFLNIGIILNGEQLVHYGTEYRIAEAGDVLILPPGSDYELLTPVKCEKIGLIIRGRQLGPLLAGCGFSTCTILSPTNTDYLDGCFLRLGQLMTEMHLLGVRRKASELCYEIIQYLASPDPGDIYPASLAAALELIGAKYAEKLSVADLAAAGGVGESTITQLFRRHFDMTPHRYLTSHRMRQAEAMLHQHNFLVKEVAERVGYENPLNFSTEFRKFFGVSPTQLLSVK